MDHWIIVLNFINESSNPQFLMQLFSAQQNVIWELQEQQNDSFNFVKSNKIILWLQTTCKSH